MLLIPTIKRGNVERKKIETNVVFHIYWSCKTKNIQGNLKIKEGNRVEIRLPKENPLSSIVYNFEKKISL